MRCKNCGWENAEGVSRCEKCNCELRTDSAREVVSDRLRGTVSETSVFAEASGGDDSTCPRCGYPLAEGSNSCPSCNYVLSSGGATQSIVRAGMGTVLGSPGMMNGGGNVFCTLRCISWPGEEVTYSPVTYSGETIVLTRSNTDANNNTITSREQAALVYDDGEWYIENRSTLQTTYIRVRGRVKLTKGDIIVLGNREFEFK